MESLQITLNSRTAILLDNQKRSVMQIALNKDAIPIPKDVQCSVSVISCEVLNNIIAVDSSTTQSLVLTSSQFININITGATLNRLSLSLSDYAILSALPINTQIIFSGNVLSPIVAGTVYYTKAFYAPNQFSIVATSLGSTLVSGYDVSSSTTMYVSPNTLQVTLKIPNGAYTPTTLATAINAKANTFLGTSRVFTCTANANNTLNLSINNSTFMYFNQSIPLIGLPNISTLTSNPTSNVTFASPPFLQQKYLQIGSSFLTSRNQPLCKIPVNASLGSYILYSPQVPFPVNINNDLINTFQISLLNEDGIPINNNYADWSITLQFDFSRKNKPLVTIDNNE